MLQSLKVAHRGSHSRSHGSHIENTLQAFREAYALGSDMVEFDVQLSADLIPVIFHDDSLLRLAKRRKNLFQCTWSELKSLPLVAIPRLEDFLQEHGDKAFYLELKVPKKCAGDEIYLKTLAKKCITALKGYRLHPDTLLASFHPGLLAIVVRLGWKGRYARICDSKPAALEQIRLINNKSVSENTKSKAITLELSIPRRVLKELVSAAALKKMTSVEKELLFAHTYIWEVSTQAQIKTLMKKGLRGIVSDCLDWPS